MAVSFNNIPNNIYTPLFYAEMDNSMANTATGDKRSLLIGLKNADGTAKVNTKAIFHKKTSLCAMELLYNPLPEKAIAVVAFLGKI